VTNFINNNQYSKAALSRQDLLACPLQQFSRWFDEAKQVDSQYYNAMSVATVLNGQPQSRMVLLKHFDKQGFVFFSYTTSQKGAAISQNNRVALLFFWSKQERQIRIEGEVALTNQKVSADYYYQRSKASQYSAFASKQSQPIVNREQLENKIKDLKQNHPDKVPINPNWSGYRVIPAKFEFWQGRDNRLHDRFVYQLEQDGNWQIMRLQP